MYYFTSNSILFSNSLFWSWIYSMAIFLFGNSTFGGLNWSKWSELFPFFKVLLTCRILLWFSIVLLTNFLFKVLLMKINRSFTYRRQLIIYLVLVSSSSKLISWMLLLIKLLLRSKKVLSFCVLDCWRTEFCWGNFLKFSFILWLHWFANAKTLLIWDFSFWLSLSK